MRAEDARLHLDVDVDVRDHTTVTGAHLAFGRHIVTATTTQETR